MSGVMEAGMDEGKGSRLERGEASPEGRRETRWSVRRKEEGGPAPFTFRVVM